MTLVTKDFKEACQKILFAIDNKEESVFGATLELVTADNVLNLNVTNREYYCTVKFVLDGEFKFHASVNAKTFLTLISKITTETVDLSVVGNTLKIKANGDYTIPLIFDGDKMITLPTIDLGVVTSEMTINSKYLLSLIEYNSKELLRGDMDVPTKKYYYIDGEGALTYTAGACVNTFKLDKDVKMMLTDKVVKLFKLFREDQDVNFKLGQVSNGETTQSVTKFFTDKVSIISRMPGSSLFADMPVDMIRSAANKPYPMSAVIDKDQLLQCLSRIMIFNDDAKAYGKFEVEGNHISIQDFKGGSIETLYTTQENNTEVKYNFILNLKKLKLILDGYSDDQYLTMCFGDHRSVAFKKPNVIDLIPEIKSTNG